MISNFARRSHPTAAAACACAHRDQIGIRLD
jgi:hypothetical protein